MLAWLSDNATALSILASVATVMIWLMYLHLFYRSYRLQQRPHLVIKQGSRFDLDSTCYLSNMSQQAVDVMAVLIDVHQHGEHLTFGPSDTGGAGSDKQLIHSPLHAGNYLKLGTFREFLQDAGHDIHVAALDAPEDNIILEVRVVALVGAQQVPRGARRRFRISFDDTTPQVRPVDVLPRQLSSIWHRRLARAWLEEAQQLIERNTQDN